MSEANHLLSGNGITLPLLERASLVELHPHNQVGFLAGVLRDCVHTEMLQRLHERERRLTAVAAHALYLASGRKPIMENFSVAFGENARYRAWLHVFADESRSAKTTPVYVEQFHNHRYGLASLILEGGYTAREKRIDDLDGHEVVKGAMTLDEWSDFNGTLHYTEAIYRPGDVMVMYPDEAHCLTNLVPGTKTFVLETPTTRDYSVVFSDDGVRAQRIIPDMVGSRNKFLGAEANKHPS